MPLLLLFCKRPQLGFGKQRLAAEIGAEAAFEIQKLMVQCAMEDLANWHGPVVFAPSSEEDILWAQELLVQYDIGDGLVLPQIEGSMGDRINALDVALREMGFDRILIIGSDSPAMTDKDLAEAVMVLDEHDVVLAPARDGGVTLMGSTKQWPPLSALPWSKENFGLSLERHCRDQGLRVGHSAISYDIDSLDDLQDLFRDFNNRGSLSQARKALYNKIIQLQDVAKGA